MTAVWPELVEVEVSGQRARRRDLIAMDPEHLAGEIEAAWPTYIATFWKRNASIGLAMWGKDEVEGELRLLLVESAAAFDPSKGRGSFPAWAASQQRRRLIDRARARMGRRLCDLSTRRSRGEQLTADELRALAAWEAVNAPLSLDAFEPRQLDRLTEQRNDPMNIEQCSRCDDTADLISSANVTSIEEAAATIGCPAPSLHVHLVQHDRDDLLASLTYVGEPIIAAKVEETTVVLPPPVEVCDCGTQNVHGGTVEIGGTKHSVDKCAGCCTHGTFLDERCAGCGEDRSYSTTSAADASITSTDASAAEWPESPDPHEWASDVVASIANEHPSGGVRAAASELLSALISYEASEFVRGQLEELVAQRDALNAQIEELAARLGDVEHAPEPEPTLRRSEKPVRNLSAQDLGVVDDESPKVIRAWCRENGVHCPATGRVPRAAVEAYRAAHS